MLSRLSLPPNPRKCVQLTIMIALLQPAPETFELFDDVMLLSEGHLVYFGPRPGVVPYFESMGFRLPPRKGIADFLQEVTSKKDQQARQSLLDEKYALWAAFAAHHSCHKESAAILGGRRRQL